MCLSKLTTKKPLIAEEDIICFKVLEKTHHGDFRSPYEQFEYEIDKVYTQSDFGVFTRDGNIEIGFHTFSELNGAMQEMKDWNGPKYFVVKCVIPKGSPYFVGSFFVYRDPLISYCSKSIKVISLV